MLKVDQNLGCIPKLDTCMTGNRDKDSNDTAAELRRNLFAGQKGLRNQPYYYDEKKEQGSIMLTPTAWAKLDEIAEKAGLSRSEFLERALRGLIPFPGIYLPGH